MKVKQQFKAKDLEKKELIQMITKYYNIKKYSDDFEEPEQEKSTNKGYTVIKNVEPAQSNQVVPPIDTHNRDLIIKKLRGALK